MTNDKLEAIRRRDQSPYMASTTWLSQSEEDRRALLSAYDALAAAARKVCCGRCGLFPDEQSHDECTADCPDCADLRKLLEGER